MRINNNIPIITTITTPPTGHSERINTVAVFDKSAEEVSPFIVSCGDDKVCCFVVVVVVV